MATDSRKDNDKDRHMPVHNGGGDTLRRIEVITGTGRRRRWDAETKGRLVAERALSRAAACLSWPGVTTSAPVFYFFGGGRRRKMPRARCEAARHSYLWWWPVTRRRRLW